MAKRKKKNIHSLYAIESTRYDFQNKISTATIKCTINNKEYTATTKLEEQDRDIESRFLGCDICIRKCLKDLAQDLLPILNKKKEQLINEKNLLKTNTKSKIKAVSAQIEELERYTMNIHKDIQTIVDNYRAEKQRWENLKAAAQKRKAAVKNNLFV